MEEKIKEYRIFYASGDSINDNGTRLGTFDMLREDFPDAAIILVNEVPNNWCSMAVENGQLVPASKEVLEARRMIENSRKAEALRVERDRQLAQTDKYLIPDFPISDQEREKYRTYRQYLRDLPQTDGFPKVPVMTFGEFTGAE